MRKSFKSLLSVALSAAMVLTLGGVSGVASAEETTTDAPAYVYHAYLGFQADNWVFRDPCDSPDLGLTSKDYNYLSQVGASTTDGMKGFDVTIKDAEITADGTYTIGIYDMDKSGVDFSTATKFNMLYISSDFDYSMPGVTFTDVSLKIDGAEVAKIDTAPVKKECISYVAAGMDKNYQNMVINDYAKDGDKDYPGVAGESIALPKSSIEVTFTVSGIDFTKSYNTLTIGTAAGKKFTSGNLTYKVTEAATEKSGKVTNGKVSVVGLAKSSTTSVVIPATIKNDGATYKVNAVAANAFKGSKLKSITLGKNIKSIKSGVFVNCKNLTTLKCSAKLSSVAKDSFKGCSKTIKVTGTSAAANKKLLAKRNTKVKFK